MDRNREARRSTMVTTNGLHRRRYKSTSRRNSPEEDERMEPQESVRLRDRLNKRDRDRDRDKERDRYRDRERERDRDLPNKNQRRRGDGFGSQHRSNREEGEEDSEEESYEEAEREADGSSVRPRIILPPHTACSSSSMSNHKILPLSRVDRPSPVFRAAADEMIGVSVPRKPRSSLVKRPHDNWTSSGSGGCGVGREQKRRSREADSPSSSTVSDKKKLKAIVTSNRPSAQDDTDIEFEVAEALFGLAKHSSKKSEATADSFQKVDKKVPNSFAENTVSSVSSPVKSLQTTPKNSALKENTAAASDHAAEEATKSKNLETEDGSTVVPANKSEADQSAKTEVCSKSDNASEIGLGACGAAYDKIAAKDASGLSSELKKVTESENLKVAIESQDKGQSKEGPLSLKEELPSRTDLDVKFPDSKESSKLLAPEVENQPMKKFEIDLMAPPPMPLSPERDGVNGLVSDSKSIDNVVEAKPEVFGNGKERPERDIEKGGIIESEEEKREAIVVKRETPKLGSEKLGQDSASIGKSRVQQESQKYMQQNTGGAIPEADQSGQNGLLPLPIPLAAWPNTFSPLGCMPSFPTVVPIDGAAGPPRAFQPPPFLHSQPRPKRCATHQYIARNIHLHQQFTKRNQFWPAADGSASLSGVDKPNNISTMSSTGDMIFSTPSQGSVSGLKLNVFQDKGKSAANSVTHSGKDKSSEAYSEQKNQLVSQQIQQPAVAGNPLHGPAYIFPLSQHQGAAATINNQNGTSKSATSTKVASTSSNAGSGVPTSSSALPTAGGSVSVQCPNASPSEAPFITMLQNNGYPFPISASDGSSPALRGTAAQSLPIFTGPFFSSPSFHPSQLHQQQPHSQSMVQATQQNSSMSGGSSSSQKQTQVQLQKAAQTGGSNFFISTDVQFQQQPKQHGSFSGQSYKFEAAASGENVSSVDSRHNQVQKNAYGQNITVPMQPMNFTLVPTSTLIGTGNGKQELQHSQQQAIKGVELIPSQPFAMSFASFAANTPTTLSFSSMAQNPPLFPSATNVFQQGYQVPPHAQMAQQKNIPIPQGKGGGESGSSDGGKKAIMGKTPANAGQTLVFDNSARTLNFMSSIITENRPSRSSTLTTLATTASIPSNSSNSQQQLLELQKQHPLQQQPVGASRSKASTTNSNASFSVTAKFPSYPPVFTHPFIQCTSVAQPSQCKNLARLSTSQVSMTVPASSNLKSLSQQQGKPSSVVTQICFGGSHKSAAGPHGQQINSNNRSSFPSVIESPPIRTTSAASKATVTSQQNDNSSNTSSQKSSPVCGRNVPSVLSTCPSHISELKY